MSYVDIDILETLIETVIENAGRKAAAETETEAEAEADRDINAAKCQTRADYAAADLNTAKSHLIDVIKKYVKQEVDLANRFLLKEKTMEQVIIHVNGGVAEVACKSDNVQVSIVDFDNLEAEIDMDMETIKPD